MNKQFKYNGPNTRIRIGGIKRAISNGEIIEIDIKDQKNSLILKMKNFVEIKADVIKDIKKEDNKKIIKKIIKEDIKKDDEIITIDVENETNHKKVIKKRKTKKTKKINKK